MDKVMEEKDIKMLFMRKANKKPKTLEEMCEEYVEQIRKFSKKPTKVAFKKFVKAIDSDEQSSGKIYEGYVVARVAVEQVEDGRLLVVCYGEDGRGKEYIVKEKDITRL